MKYLPNYIIYKQALRYLEPEEKARLKSILLKLNGNHKTFLNSLVQSFDVEKFKNSPLVWQDIWLYNYIKFDATDKIRRNGLIAKYEREIFIDDDTEFFTKKDYLNSLPFK